MKRKSNRFAVICLVLSAALALVAVSLAAYTSLSSVKRVVAVKGTEQLFTSNILIPYSTENELQTRIVSFADNTEKKIVEIDVANYLQGDITKYDTYGISYELKIEVVDITGNRVNDSAIYSAYLIDENAMSDNPYVVEGNLNGRSAHKDTYSVEIPTQYMSTYRLKVTAIPKDSRYSSIGRVIATSTEKFTPHWSGKFLDTEKAAVMAGEELGVINYQISGHVEETCVLSWDSSKVEIDPWFLSDVGVSEQEIIEKGNRKEVKLILGTENTPDQYDIKFYRTLSSKDVKETWDDISNPETGYITFKNSVTG